MEMNKYRERILNMGKETDARILLPEIGDKRIQEASAELTSLGFKVVYNQDFQDNVDIYLDYLNTLSFTENWPAENLREFLNNPLHFGVNPNIIGSYFSQFFQVNGCTFFILIIFCNFY